MTDVKSIVQDWFDEAEEKITQLDEDQAIQLAKSTGSKGTYSPEELEMKIHLLHSYADGAPRRIAEEIDEAFKINLDDFFSSMSKVDIKTYSVSRQIPFQDPNLAVGTPARENIYLEDLFMPGRSLGNQLNREYQEYMHQLHEQLGRDADAFTEADYRNLAMNVASYHYTSVRDKVTKAVASYSLTLVATSLPVIGPHTLGLR